MLELFFFFVYLTMIFMATGIFNILTTGVTSSMTRNMWKNCRTLLVRTVGLILFYAVGNQNLGEKCVFPNFLYILMEFSSNTREKRKPKAPSPRCSALSRVSITILINSHVIFLADFLGRLRFSIVTENSV
jgi:hypothetical protein